VEFGAHLPLIEFEGETRSLADLRTYTHTAGELGFTFLCANDHLLFSRPWLDGLTALAALIEASGEMALATSVCLPVIRGPVQTAKTLAAIDLLSGGRLVVGVGPGSSDRDYAAVGLPFEERWKRFDEAVRALRALLGRDAPAFEGAFYATKEIALAPRPAVGRPPIWIASWGSPAGLRRAARLGDGWLASGYNTTPARFQEGVEHLSAQLDAAGRASEHFPNGLATMWLYVTEDRKAADRMLTDVLGPMLKRPVEALRELSLPIGPAESCAERLAAFADAGVQRAFLWPLADELEQLEAFHDRVAPLVRASARRPS
jgi:alkanesulfonate monooxygenase SsuD/methylene tetrahydromethanopterin reductase-like flavin-dependent oxidoreductase (luciferase family)